MMVRCGLNRLNQFGSFLGKHLQNSRQDSKLLSFLTSLDEVVYTGVPLSDEDEQWAFEKGIKLRVRLNF